MYMQHFSKKKILKIRTQFLIGGVGSENYLKSLNKRISKKY